MKDFDSIPVTELGLSNGIADKLLKNNINNFAELKSFDFSKKIQGIGAVKINEINKVIEFINEYSINPTNRPYFELTDLSNSNFLNNLTALSKIILDLYKPNQYYYEIIDLYFGINSNPPLTYEQIGDKFNLHKESIHQKYDESLSIMSKVLNNSFLFYSLRIPSPFFEQMNTIKQKVNQIGNYISLADFSLELSNIFEISHFSKNKNILRYLLRLLNFVQIPESKFLSISMKEVWFNEINSNREDLIKVANDSRDFLKNNIIAADYNTIFENLSSSYKFPLTDELLTASLFLCNEIEQLPDYSFQLKFNYFSTISDKAYRVMLELNKDLEINEILDEVNNRLRFYNAEEITIDSLRPALNGYNKIYPIGKTSRFSLHPVPKTNMSIKSLITDCLEKYNKPLTYDEILDCVKKERDFIKPDSVRSLLSDKTFLKRDDKFELRKWTNEKYIKKKKHNLDYALILYNYFSDNKIEKYNQRLFIKNILPKLKVNEKTFRLYIHLNKFPFLNVAIDPTNGNKSIFFDSTQPLEIKVNKNRYFKDISDFILSIVKKQNELNLKSLFNLVQDKYEIKKVTFYKLVSDLVKKGSISKTTSNNKQVFVSLKIDD